MTVYAKMTLAPCMLLFGLAAFGQTFGQTYKIPGWGRSGKNSTGYFMALDRGIVHGGVASAMIRCDSPHCSQFGDIVQTIQADVYRGQRLRLSAWIRGSKAEQANLWMRVDAPDSSRLAFDSRGKSGTFNWHRESIVLNVDPSACVILFGLLLKGGGQAWLDDVTLETVDKKTHPTNILTGRPQVHEGAAIEQRAHDTSPPQPLNLDFEQPVVTVETKR